jgi:hypothetical protein
MTGATNGLEKKQAAKYGGTEGYKEYVANTPKLVPFTGGDKVEKFEEDVCVCVCVCVYIHTCVHTYIHTYKRCMYMYI